MSYGRKQGKWILLLLFVCVAYNGYFLFFMMPENVAELVYLDVLLGICIVSFLYIDIHRYKKKEAVKREALQSKGLVSSMEEQMEQMENMELVLHDTRILQEQLRQQFDANCDLEDYITRWCHEIKIPLSASLLMMEQIREPELKKSMEEQLEKMNQQLRQALLGCKVQSSMFDLQIHPVQLMDCVRTSLQNNQFFLLRRKFELDIRVGTETVYTDASWMVYVLDQLISNAVKYAGVHPFLRIWSQKAETETKLYIEDHGEGILEQDIRRIFEKGFTGRNNHNGKYKSTGMGLYMVSVILKRLGHGIDAESVPGSYTRFTLTFTDNREHFFRQ